jgi:hypothetical protein
VDLGLYDIDRAAKPLGRMDRFINREYGLSARHWHPIFSKQGLGLMLMNVHRF